MEIKSTILHCQYHLLVKEFSTITTLIVWIFLTSLCFPYHVIVSALEPAIISVLCRSLGDCHHIHIVPPVFVLAITSDLCPRSWYPPSCLPCVPRLNYRHHVSLLSSVFVPAITSTLCLCLSACHPVYIVSPSWCPPSYQSSI